MEQAEHELALFTLKEEPSGYVVVPKALLAELKQARIVVRVAIREVGAE